MKWTVLVLWSSPMRSLRWSEVFKICTLKQTNYSHVAYRSLLTLTSFSSPAQSFVLPQDSANSVPIVSQNHRSLGSEPLFVVPHEGAVADLCTWRDTATTFYRLRFYRLRYEHMKHKHANSFKASHKQQFKQI